MQIRQHAAKGGAKGSGDEIEHREVVRIITPGTVVEDALLDERASNYILCVNILASKTGIAFIDVSTGEFFLTEFNDDPHHSTLRSEIERLKPAEIVIPRSLEFVRRADASDAADVADATAHAMTPYDDFHFDYEEAYSRILRFYGVISLEGFGCEMLKSAISAAGALLSLEDTYRRMKHITENIFHHRFHDH